MSDLKHIKPETIRDIIKSIEGETVNYGDPTDLIWRLAIAVDKELDEMYSRIEELKSELGL